MKAIIISIGDELTSGQTVDTNSSHLARQLEAMGIATAAHVTVGDDRAATARVICSAAADAELVLVTGGLGPTADDLTRQALADAMGGVELVEDAASLAAMEEFFRRRGRVMVDANRIQAMFPVGSRAIPNCCGTAAGIAAKVGKASVYIMPGVPREMRRMFAEQIAPELAISGQAVVRRTLHTFGTGESDVGSRIADLMVRDANPVVGTTVAAGLVSVRVVARGDSAERAQALAGATIAELSSRLGEWVIGEGDRAMPSAVADLLRSRGQTLATAESCTGGLIGKLLTDVAGSSEIYLGGVVSYANRVKAGLLDVSEQALGEFGAVSEAVAGEMARGCRERLGADWAVSTTGIAGPGGGSEEKPVGLVYIGLAGPGVDAVQRHVFPGDRETIRLRSALAALNCVRLAAMR